MSAQPDHSAPPPLRFELERGPGIERLQDDWLDLERRSHESFFLTWTWIGSWLKALPPSLTPLVLRGYANQRLALIGILCEGSGRFRGFLPRRQLLLHESGIPEIDRLFIEYNGFLSAHGGISGSVQALNWLIANLPTWHFLRIAGLRASAADELASQTALSLRIRDRQPDRWHEFTRGQEGASELLDEIGASSRAAARRSFRKLGEFGALTLSPAPDLQDALNAFDELIELHSASWRRRGSAGAFDHPSIRAFHRNLITSGFAANQIELLRLKAGEHLLGVLYNFLHRRTVLNYQSGFALDTHRDFRPGLIAHVLAMQRYRDAGSASYHFLAGDNRLKLSLSNRETELAWVELWRNPVLPKLEQLARAAKNRVSNLISAR